jgi:hypothetical protein
MLKAVEERREIPSVDCLGEDQDQGAISRDMGLWVESPVGSSEASSFKTMGFLCSDIR